MTTVRQPKTSVNIIPAAIEAQNTGQKILFIGQKTSSGSATAGVLIQNIANGGVEDALFGTDSMLATLIRANKKRNQQIQVDAIALDDSGSGTQAAGSFDISGTATESGTLTIIAGSERNHSYTIAVTSGDTATTVGDAIAAAITADTKCPLTASNTTGTVTVTAVNAGTYGNSIPLEIREQVAGISTAVTGMTGGATDPVLTGVFDPIANSRYQAVVWPYPSNTTEVRSVLDPRFNADGVILDGVAFTAINDTLANLTSLATPLNSQSLVVFGGKQENETNYKGGDLVEIPMLKPAAFAGFRALRLDVSAFSIADIVIATNGLRDSFGGPALASKPYFNTPFADFLPIKTGRGFDGAEIETLKDAGVSVVGNNTAGNTIITGEVVTTYKTDSAGNADISFTFLNYVDTASQVREYFYNNYVKRFSQDRLTTGDTIGTRAMVNQNTVVTYSKSLYQDLSGVDYVLLEAGAEALGFFVDNLIITIDKALGRITVSMRAPLVTQYRENNTAMQITFDTNQ